MVQHTVVFLLAVGLAMPPAQAPTFRAGVDVVRIDAVVVDAKGEPIRGLKATDFTISEDGKPRDVVAFDAIDVPVEHAASPDEAPWIRKAPRDVVTNKLEDRRLFMILIDDAVMPGEPHAIARAKSIARDVVSRLGANDQAAIVFSMMSKKSQSFTADHARLEAAIAETSTGGGSGSLPGFPSAWTLANAVSALKSAPQARKTLVLISAGVTFDSSSLGPVMSSMTANGMPDEATARIRDELNRLFADAVREHVSVYSFDVNELDYVAPGWPPPLPDLNSSQRNYLRTVADNTGGRAFIANDDPVQGVTQMFRESSQYYLLGFTSASGAPGRHRVEIRTTHPGAKVLVRKVFEIEAPAKAAAVPASPIAAAIAGLLPVDSLPMRVTATPLPGPTANESVVAITLGINQPAERLAAAERMTAQIDAYESTGKFIKATKLDAQLMLNPGATGRAQYDLLAKLSLKAGRYQLRIGAHVPRLSLRGSVFVDVDVPDFSRSGVTVAPLVLSTSPAPAAAPTNAFVGLLPVVPTSHRSFGEADNVSILARIVQGGKKPLVPVVIETTVVDGMNRRILSKNETVPPDARGVFRSHDYAFELPMARLPIGDYLLTVKATTPDGTNEKTLRFSRR